MSTLKVNTIQSYTAADPVEIIDALRVSGSTTLTVNVSSINSGSFNYVNSATKVKTENLHVGTNHSSPYNQSIGTIFQTSSTDNLKIIVEKLPRISGIIGVSQLLLSTGSLFTVSGSQLPFSGSTNQLNQISSSLFMMVATGA